MRLDSSPPSCGKDVFGNGRRAAKSASFSGGSTSRDSRDQTDKFLQSVPAFVSNSVVNNNKEDMFDMIVVVCGHPSVSNSSQQSTKRYTVQDMMSLRIIG